MGGDLEWRVRNREDRTGGDTLPFLPIIMLSYSYPGHEDCLELLLEHSPFSYLEGNPFTPLHCAV